MSSFEKYLLSDGELDWRSSVFIVCLFHHLSGFLKCLAGSLMVRFHLRDEHRCGFISDFNLFIGDCRLLSIIEQERRYTSRTGGLGIVCKFGKS